MSYSEIWAQFENIMSERITKTAGKNDPDYNIIPEKDKDMLTDSTGYELVEIAHPDQIQVSNSIINDGIFENGVERQKAMVDVALRNPRGILAELMRTLVKAANALDQDMSKDSFKMAREIDDFLVVLGQQSQVVLSPEKAKEYDRSRLSDLTNVVNQCVDAFTGLIINLQLRLANMIGDNADGKYIISFIHDAVKKLNEFLTASSIGSAYELAQYVNQFYNVIRDRIEESKKITSWQNTLRGVSQGDVAENAEKAWVVLKKNTDGWLTRVLDTKQKSEIPTLEQTVPGVASKLHPSVLSPMTSGPTSRAHNYSVYGKSVLELQELLGVDLDRKFGPQTWRAVMKESNTDKNLEGLLNDNPELKGGFKNWKESNVRNAADKINQFRQFEINSKTKVKDKTEDFYSLMDSTDRRSKPTSAEMDKEDSIEAGTTKWNQNYRTQEHDSQAGGVGRGPSQLQESNSSSRVDARKLKSLQTLYPEIQIIENRVYPYGFGRGTGKPNYPYNANSIQYLLRGGLATKNRQV